MLYRFSIACFALLMTTACREKKAPQPAAAAQQTGIASWYGVPFDGRPTASGEIFDKEKLTAAHRTLPFGSRVRVHNLSNQMTVDVRVNDRGPFVKGRILDMAQAAARSINVPGTANVSLEILSIPAHRAADTFGVQVAMLENQDEAIRLRQSLEDQYGQASLSLRDGEPPLWRVIAGMEPTEAAAEALAQRIKEVKGEVFIVRIDPQ